MAKVAPKPNTLERTFALSPKRVQLRFKRVGDTGKVLEFTVWKESTLRYKCHFSFQTPEQLIHKLEHLTEYTAQQEYYEMFAKYKLE
jgi:hypothetical protein